MSDIDRDRPPVEQPQTVELCKDCGQRMSAHPDYGKTAARALRAIAAAPEVTQ